MSDMIGGEVPLPPSELQSPLLRNHGDAVAAHCVRRCYETWPELDQRYGERGRQCVARDTAWHLEHLDEAVAVGEPRIFEDYTDWLAGLLQSRGIGPEQLASAFGFLTEGFEGVECPTSQDAERGVFLAILRENQSRLRGSASDPSPHEVPEIRSANPTGTIPAVNPSGTPPYLTFFNCLMKLDRQGAFAEAEAYLSENDDMLGLYVDVLEPAMVHSGREWECGRISVAHEHYISEVTRDIIRHYGPRAWSGASPVAPVAVVCCGPRERHGIGLMMVADALRAGGLEVHMLGEALPADAAADFVDRVQANLLCVSCTMEAHLSDARELIAHARRSRPGLAVAVGGPAVLSLGEKAIERLGADWTAADAREIRQNLPAWSLEMRRRSTLSETV